MKQYLCILSVIQLLLSWGQPWGVVDIHSEPSLEETFSLCQWVCQSQIAARVGASVHFPVSLLGPHLVWICVGPVHIATVSVSSYMHQFCCVWKALFLWSHSSPLSLMMFPSPLPHRFLSPEGKALMKTSHLGLNVSEFLILYTLPNGCFCVIPYIWQEEVSLMWIEKGTDVWA